MAVPVWVAPESADPDLAGWAGAAQESADPASADRGSVGRALAARESVPDAAVPGRESAGPAWDRVLVPVPGWDLPVLAAGMGRQ